MKSMKLTAEEKEILKAYEEGKLVSVPNAEEEKKRFQEMAKAMVKKKNINIRVSETDLSKLKEKASENGIPYQTLVGSIIHRYVNKGSVSSDDF